MLIVQVTGVDIIKLFFFFVTDTREKQAKSFVPGKLYHTNLLFASKAGAYPSGEEPSPLDGLSHKHYNVLEGLAREKRSSLCSLVVNCVSRKRFTTLTTGPNVITLFAAVIYELS